MSNIFHRRHWHPQRKWYESPYYWIGLIPYIEFPECMLPERTIKGVIHGWWLWFKFKYSVVKFQLFELPKLRKP